MTTLSWRRALAFPAVGALALSLGLSACTSSPSHKKTSAVKTTASAASEDWPYWGANTDNSRYSTLTQVNTHNVNKLGIAWDHPEGSDLATWENYPVVVGDTMYITTDADEVEALNAATGAVKWTYTPKVNFYLAVAGGGGGVPTNRGVAVAHGKVYLATFDDKLVALEQATGEKLWQTQISDPNDGYSETSAPTVYKNTVYVGSAESDAGLRGFVAAYNATTGAEKWRFYTIPAAGHGWVPAAGDHGGGDVWMSPTIDTANNTLYFGTGNPSPDFIISDRPGCDPYVDATVALNATTGALRWAHTEVCNDAWDYDTHQPPMLFDLKIGGKTVQAVGNANKSGYYTVMNAQTGKVISKSPYLAPYTRPHLVPTTKGVKVCPGSSGGIEYSPASFSPETDAVYQDALSECQEFTSESVALANIHKTGQVDTGGSATPLPNTPSTPIAGYLASIDPITGKINWKDTFSKFSVGGTMATAGGLVFTGDDNGNLYAADAKTGKILWKGHIGLPFGAAPMTYEVGGTQYVAVVAGGSAVSAVPTGGELVVFKLHGSPVHTFPPTTTAVGGLSHAEMPNLASYKKVAPYVYSDPSAKKGVIQLIAGATTANNGFNYDGYAKGQATFVVPAGWTMELEFSNKASIAHSVAITKKDTPPATPVTLGFGPVQIPANPVQGLKSTAGTAVTGFSTSYPGSYYLVCEVPGHLAAGMYDKLLVSRTATQPTLEVKK